MFPIQKSPALNWRMVLRAAVMMGLVVTLVRITSEETFAQDVSESVADQAASNAADQATAAAADQAESNAADQAEATALGQARADAIDEAATSAADRAASNAIDHAAGSTIELPGVFEKHEPVSDDPYNAADESVVGAGNSTPLLNMATEEKGDNSSTTTHVGKTGTSDVDENDTQSHQNNSADTESDDEQQSNVERAANITEAVQVERDFHGDEVRAREIVVMLEGQNNGSIGEMGLTVMESRSLDTLGGKLLRIRVPNSMDVRKVLRAIRSAEPDAIAVPNHLYRIAEGSFAARPSRIKLHSAISGNLDGMVGIIDTPVDRAYPGIAGALLETRSFADGPNADATHGTAVAELISRQNVGVIAANVFARDTKGGNAAATDAVINALNWLVSRGAAIINLSIEGPADQAIAEAIRRAQAKGCIIVAAAGNNGPAAPPAYPAAFLGVIAVTAIDRNDRVYRYANQGAYISFSAVGVDVRTALPPDGTQVSSGTSFAAPVVAGLLAHYDHDGSVESAKAALAWLKRNARHLGTPGYNPVFGYGALDSALSVEASADDNRPSAPGISAVVTTNVNAAIDAKKIAVRTASVIQHPVGRAVRKKFHPEK